MSRNIFVISDTHFNHKNILFFTYGEDKKLVRPGFSSVGHMNQTIIDNWNKTVKDDDIVYHLGDFAFGSRKEWPKLIDCLNGRKRLILGNHDEDPRKYLTYYCDNEKRYYRMFEKVMSYRQFGTDEFKKPIVLCHFPLHITAFDYRVGYEGLNVHGHLHQNLTGEPHHINVCVEHCNYTPVSIEDIVDGKYKNVRIS